MLQVSTVNSSLRVAAASLRMAVEWGALETRPRSRCYQVRGTVSELLPRKKKPVSSGCARTCSVQLPQSSWTRACGPKSASGCAGNAITWVNGRHGTLLVTHGKTAAARRVLPMTPRVRSILEARWERCWKARRGLGVACTDS